MILIALPCILHYIACRSYYSVRQQLAVASVNSNIEKCASKAETNVVYRIRLSCLILSPSLNCILFFPK